MSNISKYIVTVREVWTQGYLVEATSEEEAIRKVADDEDSDAIEDLFEYSRTLDTDSWTIEKVIDNEY